MPFKAGLSEDWKSRGGGVHSNVVGIIFPLVEIGLTNHPKTGAPCPYGPEKHTQREATAPKFLSELIFCPTTILTNLKRNMIPPWGQCQDYKLHKIITFWQASSQWNSFSRQEGCISSNKLFNKWRLKTLWSPIQIPQNIV
jgi:hypothetical protein